MLFSLQCYCCTGCLFSCVQIFLRNSEHESILSVNKHNIPWRSLIVISGELCYWGFFFFMHLMIINLTK